MAYCLDGTRAWSNKALKILEADQMRSADTHLIPVSLPGFPSIELYLKDESVHPSGSLKHRLARSLFLYSIVNGWVHEGTTVIENSSGSTAVSEAYFARLLGIKFVAVMPTSTSPQKIALIERYHGACHFVENASQCEGECQRLAKENATYHFMNQFQYAERATDYRGNNNIAESLFMQMSKEQYSEPTFVVCGAGTGGTSATLGRYVRYKGLSTSIVVADPDNSVFTPYFTTGDRSLTCTTPGKIEGIGRGRVEASFIRTCVDAMVHVPDTYSMGAVLFLEGFLGRRVGSSTGTIFCAALTMALHMVADGKAGSIVAILCDGGERYASTVYNPQWREAKGLEEGVQAAKLKIAAMCCPGSGGGEGGGAGAGAGAGVGGAVCGYCPPPMALLEASQDWPCKCVIRPTSDAVE